MGKVTSEISMSLDGYITGPNVGVGTTYTFVTDGIEAALELAHAAAGDKNAGIWAERTSSGST